MLEMKYGDSGDALTLANKNRVASKKIFEQLQQVCKLGILKVCQIPDCE